MLIFWERILLSLYFPFTDLILNKVHHHPTVPPSMIRTEAGAQLWEFKNRRGYVRFSYGCQGFPCQNCWLSLFSRKAVAKQQQYSTCHWNYGQGIELLPIEQWSLIIWLNYSLLIILRVLSGSNVWKLGEISSSLCYRNGTNEMYIPGKGSDPSHFFPSPWYVKKRESKLHIPGSMGNYELCKSHACVTESRIRGSSHLSPSCLSFLGLYTEHNSSARNPDSIFSIEVMSSDQIVGWLLLRVSWDNILTSLYSKWTQKLISCMKSSNAEVIEIN